MMIRLDTDNELVLMDLLKNRYLLRVHHQQMSLSSGGNQLGETDIPDVTNEVWLQQLLTTGIMV